MFCRFLLSLGLASLFAAHAASASPRGTIHLEAESGQLTGITIATDRQGYSGTGYVTGFTGGTDKLALTIQNSAGGLYDIQIHYSAPSQKGYDLVVNGETHSDMFPSSDDKFAAHDAGNVILQNGVNTIEIHNGWGYFDIDSIDLVPAIIHPLAKLSPEPVNANATIPARRLRAYLVNEFGRHTLSGQHGFDDNNYLQTTIGTAPAILGGDFIEYSPTRLAHGSNPNDESERMIAAAKAGQIVTMMWHWNAPADLVDKMETDSQGKQVNHLWYFGFYTYGTTFDLEKAIDNPNSADYNLLISDMDSIAIQLKKFSDAGVPILWRPLHEAEGGWFWWGAKGPEPFKKLWRLMYDRFTNYYHLNNLIWVYSSGTDPAWYPGDQYVDIVGVDAYPTDIKDTENGIWKALSEEYGGRKLLALTEFGGVPDVPRMRAVGTRWSYFMSWTGDLGPKANSLDSLKTIYSSPSVITASNLPAASH